MKYSSYTKKELLELIEELEIAVEDLEEAGECQYCDSSMGLKCDNLRSELKDAEEKIEEQDEEINTLNERVEDLAYLENDDKELCDITDDVEDILNRLENLRR